MGRKKCRFVLVETLPLVGVALATLIFLRIAKGWEVSGFVLVLLVLGAVARAWSAARY